MQIRTFTPEENLDALPFVPQKKIRINDEADLAESFLEEDILDGMQPWEQAFELGAQMANDELEEAYEN